MFWDRYCNSEKRRKCCWCWYSKHVLSFGICPSSNRIRCVCIILLRCNKPVIKQKYLYRDGQLLLYNHRTRIPAILVDFSNLNVSTDLPRLVLGLAYCHKKYGSLPWKELVEPSIKFARWLFFSIDNAHWKFHTKFLYYEIYVLYCVETYCFREGFLVSKVLVQAIQLRKAEELFGHLEASQLVKVKKLPETLQSIADIPEKRKHL